MTTVFRCPSESQTVLIWRETFWYRIASFPHSDPNKPRRCHTSLEPPHLNTFRSSCCYHNQTHSHANLYSRWCKPNLPSEQRRSIEFVSMIQFGLLLNPFKRITVRDGDRQCKLHNYKEFPGKLSSKFGLSQPKNWWLECTTLWNRLLLLTHIPVISIPINCCCRYSKHNLDSSQYIS
jgi:hypothetical protein